MQRMFRAFAEQTKSDLKALAACIRGSRQTLSEQEVAAIAAPTLVVGRNRRHRRGLGRGAREPDAERAAPSTSPAATTTSRSATRLHKQGVLAFLAERP